jgi:hypothetical protein
MIVTRFQNGYGIQNGNGNLIGRRITIRIIILVDAGILMVMEMMIIVRGTEDIAGLIEVSGLITVIG